MDDHKIPNLPGAYYFSKFLDVDTQKILWEECIQTEGRKRNTITGMTGPRVKPFSEPYPKYLSLLVALLQKSDLLQKNPAQISVNVNTPENWMIAHKDGRGEKGIIVTLGSQTTLNFFYKPSEQPILYTEVHEAEKRAENITPDVTLFLEEGSVLLMTGSAFTEYAHGITAQKSDIVTCSMGNSHLISPKEGETFPRKDRVSIVLWQM